MDFPAEQPTDFMGQPAKAQGRRRLIGTIVDEEDAGTGHAVM